MEFVPLIALGALVYTLTNAAKMLQAGQVKSALTLMISWAIALVVVFVFGESDFAAAIDIGEWNLATLDAWGKVIFALTGAGVGNVAYDALPINTPRLGESASDTP